MTPFDQARAIYLREPCARSFEEDLVAHLRHGFVLSTPGAFAMFRYVRRDWPVSDILDPTKTATFNPEPDCIHVYLAAGDILEFFTFPHRRAKWISFERQNVLRFWPYQRLARLCKAPTSSSDLTGNLD